MEKAGVQCHKCRKLTPLSELRKTEGGNWICNHCYESETYISAAERFRTAKSKGTVKPEEPKTSKRYFCEDCGYKFERMRPFGERELCPYCGEQGTIKSSRNFI